MFEVNPGDARRDGRFMLDVSLATMRSMLTGGPDRQISVAGFASPEQTRCYNQALSEARARRVVDAMLDAFGPGFSGAVITPAGFTATQ